MIAPSPFCPRALFHSLGYKGSGQETDNDNVRDFYGQGRNGDDDIFPFRMGNSDQRELEREMTHDAN